MQVRAIFEAESELEGERIEVHPEVTVPLVSTLEEFRRQARLVRDVADQVLRETGAEIGYLNVTMIELPRAALLAREIAAESDFFASETNDLAQPTLGHSRDDSSKFLPRDVEEKIYPDDTFQTIDQEAVGRLVKMAVERGHAVKSGLNLGICGEHGGDPRSIPFFDSIGLDYLSFSPFRVPLARLAAAQTALEK